MSILIGTVLMLAGGMWIAVKTGGASWSLIATTLVLGGTTLAVVGLLS